MDENSPSFHNIGDPVTATDLDDDRLVYTLENARTSPFTIVRATGQLQVGEPLDYETTISYTVKVIATDTSDAKDTIAVTITVNDLEEPGKVSLSWTRPQVSTALAATLTDPDGSISGTTWLWRGLITGATGPISPGPRQPATHRSTRQGEYLQAKASYTDGEDSGKTAQAVSAMPVQAVPTDNEAPVFDLNTSGGYACIDKAEECLPARQEECPCRLRHLLSSQSH